MLGCHGAVEIYVEPLAASPDLVPFLAGCVSRRQAGCVATIIAGEGLSEPARAWHGLFADENEPIVVPFAADSHELRPFVTALEADLRASVRRSPSVRNHCEIKRYLWAGGYADIFFEVIAPPLPLVIFGGGYDVPPVVRLAKNLGWHATVVRGNRLQAGPDQFEADLEISNPLAAHGLNRALPIPLTEQTAAVVMTHNFSLDVRLLRMLLASPARISACWARARTSELLDALDAESDSNHFAGRPIDLSPANLTRLYSPVGLDIGAEGPEEIALAIVSEIKSVFAGHPAKLARSRRPDPFTHSSTQSRTSAKGLSRRILQPEEFALCNLNMPIDQPHA